VTRGFKVGLTAAVDMFGKRVPRERPIREGSSGRRLIAEQ
jgi:hypothetical protein